MRKPEIFNYQHLGGRYLGLIALAALAWVLCIVGACLEPQRFAFAYLLAWLFFFTLGAGAWFWTLVHHATRSEWSVVVGRQMENLGALLLPLAVMFVPFAFVGGWLWPGNGWAFWMKAGLYFIAIAVPASLVREISIAQDRDGCESRLSLCRRIALVSSVPFAMAITFAAFDWVMSLQHGWYSTILGVYLFAGSALGAMALLVLIVAALQRVGHLRDVVTPEHYHVMGKLLFAFTMFWGYIAFSQYLLIWYAGIPEETDWFVARGRATGVILALGQFLVPFLVLLPAWTKRSPCILFLMAAWILVMHLLDLSYLVMPALPGATFSLLDVICLVAVGSTLAIVSLKWLGDSPLHPPRDPRLPQSLALKN